MRITLRDREGMLVYREGKVVVKQAKDEKNWNALRNAWRFLNALEGTGLAPAPKLLEERTQSLVMSYVERGEELDPKIARHAAIKMLLEFKKRGIVHGDLTDPNIIWTPESTPVAIDWDQSNFAVIEARPQKRPKPDIEHIMPVVIGKTKDPSRIIRRYMACRPYISHYFGWGTFLDLGCHEGDFSGLAAVDGMRSIGVDAEYIRPCIETSLRLWGKYGCRFCKRDIVDYIEREPYRNVIMLFSTWAYIYNRNPEEGLTVIKQCIEKSDVLLCEFQLAGDGPGSAVLRTDEDVKRLLMESGAKNIDRVIELSAGADRPNRVVWSAT